MGRDMVVSRYAIPTGIPWVEGLSTGPQVLGRHIGCLLQLASVST